MQFPTNILPDEGGLIVADAFDAEILRIPEEIHLVLLQEENNSQVWAGCSVTSEIFPRSRFSVWLLS